MSTVAAPPDPSPERRPAVRAAGGGDRRPELLFGAALAAALTAVGLRAGGGLALDPTTKVEVTLDVVGGVLAALAVLAVSTRRWWGGITIGLFAVLAGAHRALDHLVGPAVGLLAGGQPDLLLPAGLRGSR